MSLEFRQVRVPEGSEPETRMQVLLQDGGGGGRGQGQGWEVAKREPRISITWTEREILNSDHPRGRWE